VPCTCDAALCFSRQTPGSACHVNPEAPLRNLPYRATIAQATPSHTDSVTASHNCSGSHPVLRGIVSPRRLGELLRSVGRVRPTPMRKHR